MDQKEKWNKRSGIVPLEKVQSQYSEKKVSLFPRGSVVCDVGGSSGVDSLFFLKKGHFVKLIDISSAGLQKAKNKAEEHGFGDKLETYQIDLNDAKISLEDNSVDIVYSRMAIHYFSKEKIEAIVSELYRILRPEGKAYIVVKSPENLDELKFIKESATEIEESVYNKKGQIISRFTKDQWMTILRNAGVENFEVETYIEDLTGRGDKTDSGQMEFILFEIIFEK